MIRVLLSLIICLSLHTLSNAQDASQTSCQNIAGTLRNLDTDRAIPNAKVALEHNGKLVAKVVTNDQGDYTFTNMEHGSYYIKATLYDYEYVYLNRVEIKECDTQYVDLDFDLGTIQTLETANVVAEQVRTVRHHIFCGGIAHAKEEATTVASEELDEKYDQEITTRALPFQSKNPQKPIKDLSIYPNPSFGQVNIELTFETLELQIFDMLGHNLGVIPFEQLEDELVSISLTYLPAGTYALQLKHEEGTDIQKVVILND